MLGPTALCLAGLAALIAGAELLTRGGGDLAARLGIPPIIVGLTVVAVGTSTPELAIGIDAVLRGNGALAVANIAGTNIVNILLILGLSALLRPLALTMQTLRMDLPVMVAAALLFWFMARDGALSRAEGLVLVGTGVVYTGIVVVLARRESRAARRAFAEQFGPPEGPAFGGGRALPSLIALVAGLVVIIAGSDWFVDGAVGLARLWGVSEAFIGLTVVAIGTSLPELVTTLLSTLKGQRDVAIGNLLGSSVFNIVFILGITCLVPAEAVPVAPLLLRIDIPVMAAVALVCVPVFLSGRAVTRLEGGIFVAAYAAYLTLLILTRT